MGASNSQPAQEPKATPEQKAASDALRETPDGLPDLTDLLHKKTKADHQLVVDAQPKVDPTEFRGLDWDSFPIEELEDEKIDQVSGYYTMHPAVGQVYRRYLQPRTIQGTWTNLERAFDIFEGIRFTTWVPDAVQIQFGADEPIDIPVENKQLKVPGFWIPMVSVWLSSIKLRFVGQDQPDSFVCQYLVGRLPQKAREQVSSVANRTKFNVGSKQYTLLAKHGTCLVQQTN